MGKLRIGLAGLGRLGQRYAENLARSVPRAELAAVCSPVEAEREWARGSLGIGTIHHSYEEMLADPSLDAVFLVTPTSLHAAQIEQALDAGKHVFCEKPLAPNHALAMEMVDAAEKAGVINMVNLTYRNVAELHKARELIATGTIGEVKHIEASYLQHWVALRDYGDPGPWLWRLSKAHGSNGTLGDIGIHIIDFTTFAVGQPIVSMHCRLQTFQKVPGDRIGEYVLDANDSFIISAEFGNGAIGTIHSSRWASGHSNDQRLRVYGNKGGLELSHGHWGTLLRVCAGEDVATATWREVKAEPVKTNYQRFVEAVRARKQDDPDFRHAAELQKVLDLALVADLDRREHRV
jgi:predicted dehydrogenase